MAEAFGLVIEGLDTLKSMDDLPQDIIKSARIAVNRAATRGRKMMADEVLRQVSLPPSYVAPAKERLFVKKNATNADLEAIINARARPTSLAQFLTKSYPPGYQPNGVRVRIQHGASRVIGGPDSSVKAFLFRLKSGADSKNNLGLAVRTSNGLPPSRAWKPSPLGDNLWLLYGPSVSQVLLDASGSKGAAVTLTPDIIEELNNEFYRQMEL